MLYIFVKHYFYMKYFSSLKTSERISLSFSIFWFLSLLLFLILINITYFFVWYADQKEMSFSSMNESYKQYLESEGSWEDIAGLKSYLLEKDTIIIPEMWELVCSEWVSKKIHEDPEIVKDKFIYRDGDTLYFIYSKYFQWVGDVKVFFDTTPYITSQIIIIKTWLIFIFIIFLLQFFVWKYISRRLLADLKNISNKVKNVDINSNNKHVICDNMSEDDEIRILAEALNTSYDMIDLQTWKLKQFLTDVSHEFKTPLMVMNSRLDVLEKKSNKNMLSQEDIENFFRLSRQNIKKLNGLLQSLFFVSKVEEQTWCLVTSQLDVKDIFQQRVLEIGEWFSHKKLSYSLDISDKLTYKVEENTFWILIDNLISNAMKFSGENMDIKIVANKDWFQICDSGPWILDIEKQKIWDKFYRVDTNIEWFWVGLYLVKRIIDMYNWNIEILSPKEWGTVFKVDISNNM